MNRAFIVEHYPWFIETFDGYDMHIKRVDAVRYFWLYHFGGVYLDMDMICMKPLDPLLKQGRRTVLECTKVCCCWTDALFCILSSLPGKAIFGYQLEDVDQDGAVANAFMAAPPGHPLFRMLMDDLWSVQDEVVVVATGPTFLTESIRRYWNNDDIVVHAMPLLYTHQWNRKDAALALCVNSDDVEKDCRGPFPLSYCTTAWSGSWTQNKSI